MGGGSAGKIIFNTNKILGIWPIYWKSDIIKIIWRNVYLILLWVSRICCESHRFVVSFTDLLWVSRICCESHGFTVSLTDLLWVSRIIQFSNLLRIATIKNNKSQFNAVLTLYRCKQNGAQGKLNSPESCQCWKHTTPLPYDYSKPSTCFTSKHGTSLKTSEP